MSPIKRGNYRKSEEVERIEEKIDAVRRLRESEERLVRFCEAKENLFNAFDGWEYRCSSLNYELIYRENSRSDTDDSRFHGASADDVIDKAKAALGVPENGWMARTGQWRSEDAEESKEEESAPKRAARKRKGPIGRIIRKKKA